MNAYPTEWHYDPDHDYISTQDLDPTFAQGSAPDLAGMVKSLANPTWNAADKTLYGDGYKHLDNPTPCYLDLDWSYMSANDGEKRSADVAGIWSDSPYSADAAYSLLQGAARTDGGGRRDLQVDEFFANAQALSGQDIGKVRAHPTDGYDISSMGWTDDDTSYAKRLVIALDSARLGPGVASGQRDHLDVAKAWEVLSSLFGLGSSFWDHWDDKSGEAAKEQFNTVIQWFSMDTAGGVFRQQALAHLAAVVATFAMAIQAARVSLDNLMHQLVQEIKAWNGQQANPVGVSITFSDILKWVKKIDPMQITTDLVSKLGDAVTKGSPQLNHDQVWDKLNGFLQESNKIMDNLVHQVDDLVAELDKVRYFRDSVNPPWDTPKPSSSTPDHTGGPRSPRAS
jgi:uncharacterized coiled-coil protein SlyX